MNLHALDLPDKRGQKKEFTFIKDSSYQGVSGVWRIDSGVPGPIVGITICTHGNEISGLAALWYFRHHFLPTEALKCGSVIFVLNDIEAAEQYFKAQTPEEEKLCRKVDDNMNRLPVDTMERSGNDSYEIRRAQELRPIWESFDSALDLHSFTQSGPPPMIVSCFAEWPELIKSWPIERVIKDIEIVQRNKPACSFYGHNGKEKRPFIGLECGSHREKSSLVIAITSTISFLRYLGVVGSLESELPSYQHRVFKIIGSVFFLDKTYRVVRSFTDGTEVRKGEVVGRNPEGKEIYSSCDGITLFWDKSDTPSDINEEVFFIAELPQQ